MEMGNSGCHSACTEPAQHQDGWWSPKWCWGTIEDQQGHDKWLISKLPNLYCQLKVWYRYIAICEKFWGLAVFHISSVFGVVGLKLQWAPQRKRDSVKSSVQAVVCSKWWCGIHTHTAKASGKGRKQRQRESGVMKQPQGTVSGKWRMRRQCGGTQRCGWLGGVRVWGVGTDSPCQG